MKQLVHIHGGETWDSYDEYIAFLKEKQIDDPLALPRKKWRSRYAEFLGDDWQFFLPRMPSYRNAKYEEWVIWFEKYVPYLHDDVVLVGSSLGAAFLMKYLSERTVPVAIAQLHLCAAPLYTRNNSFALDTTLFSQIEAQCDHISIYHSKDDFVVPFARGEQIAAAMPSATFEVFEDRGHFIGPEFPELIDALKGAS